MDYVKKYLQVDLTQTHQYWDLDKTRKINDKSQLTYEVCGHNFYATNKEV